MTPHKQPRLSRPWQILIVLLANAIMIIGLLYSLELYLARIDPRRTLPPKPIESRNSYGFRDHEFIIPKPVNVCRIMVLGDSFTWGKGVWERERYTSVLQNMLTQTYPGKNIELLNFGFPGGPTTKERDTLRDFKDRVQPDLIMVGFVLNDPQQKRQDYSEEREKFEKNYGERLTDFVEDAENIGLGHVGHTAYQALDNLLVVTGVIPPWQEALQRTYEKDSLAWQEFEQALRDIKTMSDGMDLPQPIFAVLNQGTYTDRPTDYNHPDEELQLYLSWYRQAEETAAMLGFNPVNFAPELAQQMTTEPIAVTVLDGHPSAKVHQIYAEKLFNEISATYIESGQLCPD
jgi:hypothetical protein